MAGERDALMRELQALDERRLPLHERLALAEREAMELREQGVRRPAALDQHLRTLRAQLAEAGAWRRALTARRRAMDGEDGAP